MKARMKGGPLDGQVRETDAPRLTVYVPAPAPAVPWWDLGAMDIEDALPIREVTYRTVRIEDGVHIMEVEQ